jgi:hypothetical protein
MPVSCECCVLSGRGLCFGLIPHPEESYQVWCVEWDHEALIMMRAWPTRGCRAMRGRIPIHQCLGLHAHLFTKQNAVNSSVRYMTLNASSSSHLYFKPYQDHLLLHCCKMKCCVGSLLYRTVSNYCFRFITEESYFDLLSLTPQNASAWDAKIFYMSMSGQLQAPAVLLPNTNG